jgi:hypothetical protein
MKCRISLLRRMEADKWRLHCGFSDHVETGVERKLHSVCEREREREREREME